MHVDIVLPIYNPNKIWLKEAIDSILCQTYPNWRLLVVDDGSPSPGRATEYLTALAANSSNEVRIMTLEENLGAAGARNHAITAADSTHIAFIDQDDRWHPRKLELQVEIFEECPEVGLVHGNFELIAPNGSILTGKADSENGYRNAIPYDELSETELMKSLILKNTVRIGSVLVRRSHFESIGCFNSDLFGAEDWEAWIRFASQFKLRHLNFPVYQKRVHSRNVSKIYKTKRMRGELLSLEQLMTEFPDIHEVGLRKKRSLLRQIIKREMLGDCSIGQVRQSANELIKTDGVGAKDIILFLLTRFESTFSTNLLRAYVRLT